jgi:O-antigen/teichoic acid export membrane protein
MAKTKSFGYDLFYYTITYIIPMVVGFILLPIFTENFTTEEFGQYSLITSTMGLLGIISVNWINVSLIRYYSSSKKSGNIRELTFMSLGTMFLVTTVIAILFYILKVFGLIERIIPDQYFVVAIVLLVTANLHSYLFSYLRAMRKARYATILGTVSALTRMFVFLFLLFQFQLSVNAILIGTIVGDIIYISAILISERKSLKTFKPNISVDRVFLKEFLSYGFPFIFILSVHWLLTLSDRYMIEFMRGSGEVGIYSINYSFAQQIMMPLITIFMTAAEPIIFQKYESKPLLEVNRTLNLVFKNFFMIIVPCTVGLAIIAKDLSSIFIKNEFQSGYIIITIISFGYLFLGIRQYLNKSLEIVKKSKQIAYISLIAAITNVIFNLILIPKMGYIGAAYATLIAYFVYFLLSYIKTSDVKETRIHFSVNHFKILISSIIMTIAVLIVKYLLHLQPVAMVIIEVLVGSIVYIGMIIILKAANEELSKVKNILKKRMKRNG